jgi:subtilisin family serine protease
MSFHRSSELRAAAARPSILRTVVWVSIAFVMLALSSPLQAQGHRARLSRGLAEAIEGGRAKGIILSGSPEQVRDIAARHGLRIEKQLESGAVVNVADAATLRRLAADPAVSAVAEDAKVSAHMANEIVALGADQAWSGLFDLPGVTGAGVGVAVIDSGIASQHEALRGRVVAFVDFVQSRQRGIDAYGHGTHVAGIVAGDVTTRT